MDVFAYCRNNREGKIRSHERKTYSAQAGVYPEISCLVDLESMHSATTVVTPSLKEIFDENYSADPAPSWQ